ncbi:hypothetical protein BC831DRAFT_441348 [Entophlyctis helioformis]|nr:hypothetical protein BC831DRAFT_441348 [Entophlyctis helioformis]
MRSRKAYHSPKCRQPSRRSRLYQTGLTAASARKLRMISSATSPRVCVPCWRSTTLEASPTWCLQHASSLCAVQLPSKRRRGLRT